MEEMRCNSLGPVSLMYNKHHSIYKGAELTLYLNQIVASNVQLLLY